MSGSNRVNVAIFNREYTVSGTKPRDYIVKVASHVDGVMTDISDSAESISISSLAVLSAVNIADDLFAARERLDAKETEKEQLQKDIAHYIQLWEEAKRNFLQHKEDSQAVADQMAGVQEKLNEKAIENDRLLKAAAEKDRRIAELSDEKSKVIAEITDKKDRRFKEVTTELNARIDKLTEERDQGIAAVAAKLNARIDELTKERDQGIASLTAELNARVKGLTKERDQGIASVTAKLNARIEELTKERDQGIASVTAEKDARLDELTRERNQRIASITAEKDSRIEQLGSQVNDLSTKLEQQIEMSGFSSEDVRELNDKYKELEGNYFEIQMENIRLKGEIERLNSISAGTATPVISGS
ncbi:MAG: cell division protein ZapA [Clostridiales Family XIII bacterium]|jgi:cell division protein ZapA (FtsZ GTPase activity inhibitor)|nr:cell division protein ZapA [Clostridiales Family XIII bacterium]